LALLIYILTFDNKIKSRSITPTKRAAIVIRGPNDFFQQGVTKAFTLGVLGNSYQDITYYNQKTDQDKRVIFILRVRKTLKKFPTTDIFLLGHGTRNYLFWVVNHIPMGLQKKIRLVYHSGCGGGDQGNDWINTGARAYVSHGKGLSWSPLFFYFFLHRWVRGYPLRKAVKESNALAQRDLVIFNWLTLKLLAGVNTKKATKAVLFGDAHISIDKSPEKWISLK